MRRGATDKASAIDASYYKFVSCPNLIFWMDLDNALHETNHFRGFEPQPRRYFFLKSDLNWAFLYILIHKKVISEVRKTSKLKNLYKK